MLLDSASKFGTNSHNLHIHYRQRCAETKGTIAGEQDNANEKSSVWCASNEQRMSSVSFSQRVYQMISLWCYFNHVLALHFPFQLSMALRVDRRRKLNFKDGSMCSKSAQKKKTEINETNCVCWLVAGSFITSAFWLTEILCKRMLHFTSESKFSTNLCLKSTRTYFGYKLKLLPLHTFLDRLLWPLLQDKIINN